jgi:serine protease Do
MRNLRTRCAAALLAVLVIAGRGAGQESSEPDLRRSATVRAVRKVKPSVVSVKVTHMASGGRTKEMEGTGLIVDERGYVVTNRHVVAGASRTIVRLLDGTEIRAEVVYSTPAQDLAILRVRTKHKLIAQPLVPTSDLEEGEDVIAIGHPYGYSWTVSKGIVSALNRSVEMPTGYTLNRLVQHTAAINPGNSGGPLVNINGGVIGINVAYREEAQVICFAISAETVKKVLSTQLSALKVSGVLHGLTCQEKVIGERRQPHVVVAKVDPKVAAAGADVRSGDVILAVGSRTVVNGFDVERALWDTRPGQKVSLRVQRGGQELTVTLPLAGGPAAVATASASKPRN